MYLPKQQYSDDCDFLREAPVQRIIRVIGRLRGEYDVFVSSRAMLEMPGSLLDALLPFFLLEMNGTRDMGKDMVLKDSERHCCVDER